MPKTIPLTEEEQKNNRLVQDIYGLMKVHKLTSDDMAEEMGIGRTTFYRRIQYPETFTLREIRALKKTLPEIQVE